jgi:hypothetical protein
MTTVSEVTNPPQAVDRLAEEVREEWGVAPAPVEFKPPLTEFLDRRTTTQLVVGGPRAGKTLLAAHYQWAVLEQRAEGEPVPVGLSLDTWRNGMSVRRWLVHQLARQSTLSESQVEELVRAGLIHPIFDGVDGLAAGRRPQFLREVRSLPFPVLLTSRPADFGDWLSPIELQPPLLHATLGRWKEIAEDVRCHPKGPLAEALSDPVNRHVFDLNYSDSQPGPSGLLDRSAFPDAASVERHLLDGLDAGVQSQLLNLARRARTGEDRMAWWEWPDSVTRSRLPIIALLIGAMVAVITTEWIKSAVWKSTGTALPLVVVSLITAVTALGVGGVAYRAIGSRQPVPVFVDVAQPWRWWWLLPGGLAAAGTFGAAMWLDRGWLIALYALPVGLVVLGLFWLRAAVVEHDEAVMQSQAAVTRQDSVVLTLRLAAVMALAAAFSLVATGPGFLSNTASDGSGMVLPVLVLVAMWSASARCWLSSSTRFVLSLPISAELHALVRQEGGVYFFRDEAVRRRLAEPQFENLAPGTVRSTATQVSELRFIVTEEACQRLGVDGVLSDDSTSQNFKNEIAAEINKQADAIVASTADTRRLYVAAKTRYIKRYLGLEWDNAVMVSELPPLPVGAVLIGWAALSVTWTRFGMWSSAGIVASAVALSVIAAAWWGWRQRSSRRLFWILIGATLVTAAALVAATSILEPIVPKIETWLMLTVGGLGVLCLLAMRPVLWLRERIALLTSDDPRNWPAASETHRAKDARQKAERAYRGWFDTMVERVVPLVAQRLASEEKLSYKKVLPPAKDMPRLGDVTSVAQYVPTETSKTLARMMTFMSRGAIGISGPRGVGKSTVLNVIGRLGLGARPDDVTLHVSAPTNYAARDFVVHLYAKLCRTVIEVEPDPRPKRRSWPYLAAAVVGAAVAIGGWHWPRLMDAAVWVPQHWRFLVIASGVIVAVVSLVAWAKPTRAARLSADDVVREARRRLEELRFIETTTITRAVTAKPPAVAEFGGSHARALAGQIKTLPELVEDFKSFLVLLTGRMTAEPKGRVVVCIDELDKIASPVEAERFLNDIKAIFGVERCFFLVTVSDDALASFAGRSLAVRTAFDSTFNSVLKVHRFTLSDTRLLLMQRTARLSEPFVWLCHVLSGGLPRDLNRTAYDLYDLVRRDNMHDLDVLARRLVRADRQAVTESLTARLTDRFDAFAVRLRRHIHDVGRLNLTSAALTSCERLYPPADASDDLLLINEQLRAYVGYVAAVLRLFRENTDVLVERLKVTGTGAVESLALARTWLATDPVVAAAHVEDWKRFETQ